MQKNKNSQSKKSQFKIQKNKNSQPNPRYQTSSLTIMIEYLHNLRSTLQYIGNMYISTMLIKLHTIFVQH